MNSEADVVPASVPLNPLSPLDEKINRHFAGLVVRKDLVKTVKGNAIVPTYVLEYLLGMYCASRDEEEIEAIVEEYLNDNTMIAGKLDNGSFVYAEF